MRILLVTGIYPPDVGGPATYVAQLGHNLAFPGKDKATMLVTYSSVVKAPEDKKRAYMIERVVRGNKLLNRPRFFIRVIKLLRANKYDVIYMLDWFAAGAPAALAAKIYGVPYVVRVGGDYLWEQRYLESGKEPLSLADFYKKRLHKKYPLLFLIIKWVLGNASHVIFNSDRQRGLYEKYYELKKTSTIYNPVPGVILINKDAIPDKKDFVFWGRFIVMKNLNTLVRAFAKAKLPEGYTLTLIGDGPRKNEITSLIKDLHVDGRVKCLNSIPRGQVWDMVKDSRALIITSWTDISPNTIYEAMALKLPALVSKENYLSFHDELPEMIDPYSADDIANKLEMLADDNKYMSFAAKFSSIKFEHTWDDVVQEHKKIFETVTHKKI